MDRGASAGIVLFLFGTLGLALRYFFGGGIEGLTSTVMAPMMQLGLLLVSILLGLWLIIYSLGRKPAEA